MPTYTFPDRVSGLFSTSWLLDQSDDFQHRHILVSYEDGPTVMQNPLSPTPARFGDPLQVGGWKHSGPIWVQIVPQVAACKYTTTVDIFSIYLRADMTILYCQRVWPPFKCYEPPVKLGKDELARLKEFSSSPSLVVSSPFSSGSGNLSADRSSALQTLYENNVVKRAFFQHRAIILNSDNDDDDDWEDNMPDPVTFARYCMADDTLLTNIVEDHGHEMRKRFNQGIANWIEGVQFGHSEDDTSQRGFLHLWSFT